MCTCHMQRVCGLQIEVSNGLVFSKPFNWKFTFWKTYMSLHKICKSKGVCISFYKYHFHSNNRFEKHNQI